MTSPASWERLTDRITQCRACPRLVSWREEVARTRTRRFSEQTYWGRPVPGFGDPRARLLLVGLAPAAHGANRTGRMFTGDRSGEWLYRTLHTFGFASRPESLHSGDGLTLHDCFITAACRCAPPANKPTREEFGACRPFLEEEFSLLDRVRIIIGLGKHGFDAARSVLASRHLLPATGTTFSHGCAIQLKDDRWLLGSYHPSQQNTFTGRLTRPMFNSVFRRARKILGGA